MKADCIPDNWTVATLPETCLLSRSLDLPSRFVFSLGCLSLTRNCGFSNALLPCEQKAGCAGLRGGIVVMCFLLSLVLKDFRVLSRCPGRGRSMELLKQTALVVYQRSLPVVSLKVLCFTLNLPSLLKTFFFPLSNAGSQSAQWHTRGHF